MQQRPHIESAATSPALPCLQTCHICNSTAGHCRHAHVWLAALCRLDAALPDSASASALSTAGYFPPSDRSLCCRSWFLQHRLLMRRAQWTALLHWSPLMDACTVAAIHCSTARLSSPLTGACAAAAGSYSTACSCGGRSSCTASLDKLSTDASAAAHCSTACPSSSLTRACAAAAGSCSIAC